MIKGFHPWHIQAASQAIGKIHYTRRSPQSRCRSGYSCQSQIIWFWTPFLVACVMSSAFAGTFHKFIPMQIFLCPATNVTIHAQRLMPSRNTCALIQERSLLVATNVIFPARRQVTSRYTFEPTQVGSLSCVISATILPLKFNISRHTFSHTLEQGPLHVISAVILAIAPIAWSVTCFHTPARCLLPASNATTPAQGQLCLRLTWWGSTVQTKNE